MAAHLYNKFGRSSLFGTDEEVTTLWAWPGALARIQFQRMFLDAGVASCCGVEVVELCAL